MHKIEELAGKLMDFSTQLAMCSSRYVELASLLKDVDAVKFQGLSCVLDTGTQTIAFKITFDDLTESAADKAVDEIEKQASDYATRIGLLWSQVHSLASTVKDNLANAPAGPEPQVFKVEDDN
jgi:hypothetical protein